MNYQAPKGAGFPDRFHSKANPRVFTLSEIIIAARTKQGILHKLDRVDLLIINSLIRDGRKSFRQIAKETGVSTPTVEARFSRMKSMGVIKSIEPILDTDIIENQITALVFLKVNLAHSNQIADELAALSEVKRVYMMTGENNIIAKVISERPESLEKLVRER